MPNRIIKESIKRSPEIDRLSWFEEVVFYRLIVTADDYGRLDGRPVVLRNDLFPTKDTITRKAIEDALAKLVSVGLLVPYVDAESGMPFFFFPSWEKHQRVRDSKERYPAPQAVDGSRQVAANCGELPQDAAKCGLESESKSESESNTSCAERPAVASTPPSGSGFVITLNDGSGYDVPRGDIETYKRLYPAVDVEAELRAMIGWCMSNPTRRKTKSGVARFITAWLKKCQDRGGTAKQNPQNYGKPNLGKDYEQREYDDAKLAHIGMTLDELTGGGC